MKTFPQQINPKHISQHLTSRTETFRSLGAYDDNKPMSVLNYGSFLIEIPRKCIIPTPLFIWVPSLRSTDVEGDGK